MAPENAAMLLSSSRRERQLLLGLSLPALILIA
jgi:hypothetical protein